MKRCFTIALLLGTAVVAAPTPRPAPRVLCIGDSITQGDKNYRSWRYGLWKLLVESDTPIDFVGTLRTNYSGNPLFRPYMGLVFDNEHDARWGWTASKVAGELPDWLRKVDADIALIHLGSNDFLKGRSAESVLSSHESIIASLRADNPKITIFVAQIISNGSPRALPDFNRALPAAAKAWSTEQSPVFVVDMVTGFDVGAMTYDNLHPHEGGEAYMAERWFSALRNAGLVAAPQP